MFPNAAPPVESSAEPGPCAAAASPRRGTEGPGDAATGTFVRGVAVVTSARAGDAGARALLAGGFSSLSLAPPLCTVVVPADAEGFEPGARFGVSVLAQDQAWLHRWVAAHAAVPTGALADPDDARGGGPGIAGCAAWFGCAVARRLDAGDATIVVGEVLSFGHAGRPPLLGTPDGLMTTEPLSETAAVSTSPPSRGGER